MKAELFRIVSTELHTCAMALIEAINNHTAAINAQTTALNTKLDAIKTAIDEHGML